MSKEQEKIEAFGKHEKWSQVTAEITARLMECLKVRRELGKTNYPIEFGRFTLEPLQPAYGRDRLDLRRYTGSAFSVYCDGAELYGFGYTREPIPDKEAEASQQLPQERSFYGTKAPKPVKLETVTRAYMVDWDRIFHLEDFLQAIKDAIPDLEVELERKQGEAKDMAESFEDFLEGSAELLRDK